MVSLYQSLSPSCLPPSKLILIGMHLITIISNIPVSLILMRVHLRTERIVVSRLMSELMYFFAVQEIPISHITKAVLMRATFIHLFSYKSANNHTEVVIIHCNSSQYYSINNFDSCLLTSWNTCLHCNRLVLPQIMNTMKRVLRAENCPQNLETGDKLFWYDSWLKKIALLVVMLSEQKEPPGYHSDIIL